MMKVSLLAKSALVVTPLSFLMLGGCSGSSSNSTQATATPVATSTPVPTSGPHTANLQFESRVAAGTQSVLRLLLNPSVTDASRALNVGYHGRRAVGATQSAAGTFTTTDTKVTGVSYFEGSQGWKAAGGTIKITAYGAGRVQAGSPGKLSIQFIGVKMVPVAGTGATGEFTIDETFTAASGTV